MLELAYRRHNALDSDLLPQQGASEFRKRHLRFVPACSKINKNAARQTWGGRHANNEASRKCRDANERRRRRGGVGRVARLAGFGAIADRHRGRGGAGRRAAPGAGRVRVHGRAGRHAGRRALFLRHRPNRIYRLETNGANGLAVTREGDLLAAEGGGKRISKRSRDGTVTTVTEGIEGKPLLAPNDLILDAKGGIYFTDPGPRPVVPGRIAYVYYLPVGAKQPIVIDDQIARPNGLTLTRDGKTLIVDDTLGPTVYAYDVEPDGSVKNKRTFAQLRDIPEGKESGADGMALDREDRVYITTLTGVQVFDAAGKYLGTIKVARQPANAGFAGSDKRVLYITAREGLYRLDTLAQGPDRVGK